jgi:hypothetical protein
MPCAKQIGQLFEYGQSLYGAAGKADPQLAALFSAPIGEAYLDLLAALEIVLSGETARPGVDHRARSQRDLLPPKAPLLQFPSLAPRCAAFVRRARPAPRARMSARRAGAAARSNGVRRERCGGWGPSLGVKPPRLGGEASEAGADTCAVRK